MGSRKDVVGELKVEGAVKQAVVKESTAPKGRATGASVRLELNWLATSIRRRPLEAGALAMGFQLPRI